MKLNGVEEDDDGKRTGVGGDDTAEEGVGKVDHGGGGTGLD